MEESKVEESKVEEPTEYEEEQIENVYQMKYRHLKTPDEIIIRVSKEEAKEVYDWDEDQHGPFHLYGHIIFVEDVLAGESEVKVILREGSKIVEKSIRVTAVSESIRAGSRFSVYCSVRNKKEGDRCSLCFNKTLVVDGERGVTEWCLKRVTDLAEIAENEEAG